MSNDEDTRSLLRDIRDILLRNEKRDSKHIQENSEYTQEIRQIYRETSERKLKFTRRNLIAVWILLAVLFAVGALGLFFRVRDSGF